jgi:small subunit ribosomal protein S12e
VAEADEVEVSGDAASKGQMSVLDALKGVLKLALMHDGLARVGFFPSCKDVYR